jgi:hypothetical protein
VRPLPISVCQGDKLISSDKVTSPINALGKVQLKERWKHANRAHGETLTAAYGEQRAESDHLKRIRKLRWVDMDDEARMLQGVFDPEHADSVLAIPDATD